MHVDNRCDAGVDVDAAAGGGHAAAGPPTGGGASTPATHPNTPTSHTDTPRREAPRGMKGKWIGIIVLINVFPDQ